MLTAKKIGSALAQDVVLSALRVEEKILEAGLGRVPSTPWAFSHKLASDRGLHHWGSSAALADTSLVRVPGTYY
jgi:hypothetical protein